jgi:AcrR family transcriptional regulator
MARVPQTARGRQTRERIVQAAAGVIAEVGAGAANCDQILAQAHASKSQLYHYFEGKDDLVRAVIALRFGEIIDAQQPWLEGIDSLAGLRRWFDLVVELNEAAGSPGCALAALAADIADRDEQARQDLATSFEAWERYLSDGFSRMIECGELRRDVDVGALATAVFASVQGGLLQSKVRKDPELLRIALDAAYAHVKSHAPPVRTGGRGRVRAADGVG